MILSLVITVGNWGLDWHKQEPAGSGPARELRVLMGGGGGGGGARGRVGVGAEPKVSAVQREFCLVSFIFLSIYFLIDLFMLRYCRLLPL